MSVTLFSGTPGSGKSYHAMRCIRDALKYKGQDVIANFEVKADESWKGRFTRVANDELTPEFLATFAFDTWRDKAFAEESILLVVDEVQLLLNSRLWADDDRMKWIEFFSQHRKMGYKVILVAQSDVMIDKQIRTLIEYEVNHRKVGNYGLFGLVLKVLTLGEHTLAVRYYYAGAGSQRLDAEYIRLSKRVFEMYDSYTLFDQQARQAQRAPAGDSPVMGVVSKVRRVDTV